jgi:hypothetical protein
MEPISRKYLQNLPIQKRKEFVQQRCDLYFHSIQTHAASGVTYCLIAPDMSPTGTQTTWMKTPPSVEEIIEYLKEKFPDSTVSYEEQWRDIGPGRRELKKGILVDWS